MVSIKEDIELINPILSYDRFYPGRILGNRFTLVNKSARTIKVKLALDILDYSA